MSEELILVGIWSLGALLLIFQHKLLAYTLLAAPFILLPSALMVVVVEKLSGFSLMISISLVIICLFAVFSFFIEYPLKVDLGSEGYIDEINSKDELLVTLHTRKRIGKIRKVLNRAVYCTELIFFYLKSFIVLYLREYGSGKFLAFADYTVAERNDLMARGDLKSHREEVLRLLQQIKSTDVPEVNRVAYILISIIITWNVVSQNWLVRAIDINIYAQNQLGHVLYTLFSDYKIASAVFTLFLLVVLYYLLRCFRTCADGANIRFQLLKQYIDFLRKNDRFIVFAWVQGGTDSQAPLFVVDTLKMEYLSNIKEKNLIIHEDMVYVAINPNLSRSAFYSEIADLAESSAKFQKRISVLNGDESD